MPRPLRRDSPISPSAAAEPIICTSGHPVWSEVRKDFVPAAALNRDEPVRLASGTLSRIRFQQPHPGTASVFNLEVNRHHVYHVGRDGLLVHNSGLAGCEIGTESTRREQPRNARGQFMSPSSGDAPPGELAVEDFIARARDSGWDILGSQISVNTPFGRRRYDLVVYDPVSRKYTAFEIKSSLSAFKRRMRQQFASDRWLYKQEGLKAVGKADGILIHYVIKILWELP